MSHGFHINSGCFLDGRNTLIARGVSAGFANIFHDFTAKKTADAGGFPRSRGSPALYIFLCFADSDIIWDVDTETLCYCFRIVMDSHMLTCDDLAQTRASAREHNTCFILLVRHVYMECPKDRRSKSTEVAKWMRKYLTMRQDVLAGEDCRK